VTTKASRVGQPTGQWLPLDPVPEALARPRTIIRGLGLTGANGAQQQITSRDEAPGEPSGMPSR